MKPSTAYIPSQQLAVLCVGEPKSGKTRLAMAFPDPGILDCDGNLGSAVRVATGKKFFYSEGFRDDAGKEVPEIDRWRHCEREMKALLSNPETKSFVLDGLSNLCRWGLVHCENELVKAGINVKKEYLAKYQSFIPLLSNFLTVIRIPGKVVIVNVHQTMEKGELDGRIVYKLDIPGRLADTLGGQFTDVWGMSSVADPSTSLGAKYYIRTKPTGYHINLGTSVDLAPSIDISGMSPAQIWQVLSPKLSSAQPLQLPPTSLPTATPAVATTTR